jgi:hypothetical protein
MNMKIMYILVGLRFKFLKAFRQLEPKFRALAIYTFASIMGLNVYEYDFRFHLISIMERKLEIVANSSNIIIPSGEYLVLIVL